MKYKCFGLVLSISFSVQKEVYSFLDYIFLALYKDIYGINLAIDHAVLSLVIWFGL